MGAGGCGECLGPAFRLRAPAAPPHRRSAGPEGRHGAAGCCRPLLVASASPPLGCRLAPCSTVWICPAGPELGDPQAGLPRSSRRPRRGRHAEGQCPSHVPGRPPPRLSSVLPCRSPRSPLRPWGMGLAGRACRGRGTRAPTPELCLPVWPRSLCILEPSPESAEGSAQVPGSFHLTSDSLIRLQSGEHGQLEVPAAFGGGHGGLGQEQPGTASRSRRDRGRGWGWQAPGRTDSRVSSPSQRLCPAGCPPQAFRKASGRPLGSRRRRSGAGGLCGKGLWASVHPPAAKWGGPGGLGA